MLSARASVSTVEPVVSGTIKRTGLSEAGAWACAAGAMAAKQAAARTKRRLAEVKVGRKGCIVVSCIYWGKVAPEAQPP